MLISDFLRSPRRGRPAPVLSSAVLSWPVLGAKDGRRIPNSILPVPRRRLFHKELGVPIAKTDLEHLKAEAHVLEKKRSAQVDADAAEAGVAIFPVFE